MTRLPLMLDSKINRWIVLLSCALLGCCSRSIAADDFEYFQQRVAPILEKHCLACHDEANREGDISLVTAASLQEAGYLEPESKELIRLVTPVNGEASMPKDAKALSAGEIAALVEWIEQGAGWPSDVRLSAPVVSDLDWWSLKPLSPSGASPSDEKNIVDVFINAAIEKEGLAPNEVANPQTLIRRVTYDLTGLPPTPLEVSRFLAAWKSDPEIAWRDTVDRLLASYAFGEKFGQHWLDVARYAETHGYDKDKPRENAWPYRDYVIRSFHEDKPYVRFVQEQIAGDVLFPDEPDGVLGLGFLAAGPWDFIGHWEVGEGKLDGRIAKHLDRDEIVSAVFNVFQSTTVQCAQCHHHKFDPVRMEDYYRLHAVFAAVDRADRVYEGLSIEQQSAKDELLEKQRELTRQKQDAERQLAQRVSDQAREIDARLEDLRREFASGPQSPAFGYHSQISSKDDAVKWVQIDLGTPQLVSRVVIRPAYDDFAGIGAGFGFPIRYRVDASSDPQFNSDVRTLVDTLEKDQSNPRTRPIKIDVQESEFRYLRLTATKLRERQGDFILALGEIEVLGQANETNLAVGAAVTSADTIESGERWGRANLVDGVFYQELRDSAALEEFSTLMARRDAIVERMNTPEHRSHVEALDKGLKQVADRLRTFPEGRLVYAAATHFTGGGQFKPTQGVPREIHLVSRGDLSKPVERMWPGTPSLWESSKRSVDGPTIHSDAAGDEGAARVELASYLTDPENPLLWRSIVNRLWQWTIGAPLVGTPNDFGRNGMHPSHPELLDALATRLRDDPAHSLKQIVRSIVMSDAYRRSSRGDEVALKVDATNRLRWRGDRRRLTAEEFRDSLLQLAGVLDRSAGGPSFRDFVVNKPAHSPHYEYHLHDPADPNSHRRTIYRFVVRSQPQPMLTTLDCADPSISTPSRDESTTALQALAAWNNRLVEFAAVKFGERIIGAGSTSREQLDFACRETLGREPTPEEASVLREHLQQHGAASLARVLFNMNAFIYVD